MHFKGCIGSAGLAILRVLKRSSTPLSFTEIVREVCGGENVKFEACKSTVARALSSLASKGLIEKRGGRYTLTPEATAWLNEFCTS